MRRQRPRLSHAVLLVLAALAAGCGRGSPPGSAKPSGPEAIEEVKERGPVKVTLRVEPKEPTFADRVRFTIEAVARKGVEVTLPPPGENLGEFIIKDYDSPPLRATADATEYRRAYVLEFLTSGEYKIPPMTIAFRDLRPEAEGGKAAEKPESGQEGPAGDEKAATPDAGSEETAEDVKKDGPGGPEYKIVTDEITIVVKPLADTASLKELAPIAPPAEPPPLPAGVFWPLVAAGGIAAAALAALAVRKVLRRKRPLPPPIPPHERAYRELEWLLGQGFIDRGELKEFFFHLSRILREYIEGRFGLRAPELTTEEFLEELARRGPGSRASHGRAGPLPGAASSAVDQEIPLEHRKLLRHFLERADLVKFAKYAPQKDEIEGSFESAKRFIEGTLPTSAPAPEPGDGAPGAKARSREEAVHAGRR